MRSVKDAPQRGSWSPTQQDHLRTETGSMEADQYGECSASYHGYDLGGSASCGSQAARSHRVGREPPTKNQGQGDCDHTAASAASTPAPRCAREGLVLQQPCTPKCRTQPWKPQNHHIVTRPPHPHKQLRSSTPVATAPLCI